MATFESRLQNAATIFAPRRKGKTTFLINDLIPIAKAHGFIVATADLWFDKAHPERVIAGALYEAIHGAGFLRRNWLKLMRPGSLVQSVEAGAGTDGVTMKAELAKEGGLNLIELFERFRRLGNGKALLIIDEVQHLASKKDFEDLTATLRSLLQQAHGEVFAVFTGSSQDGLHRMFRRTKAPFYQFSHEIQFPNLGFEFVQHLGGAGRHCQFVPDCARGDSRCRMEVFMFIDITEKPASHCWGVCIDALEVNFNSQAQAQAFVDQLKARIEAPHVWPNARDSAARASRIPQARTDLV